MPIAADSLCGESPLERGESKVERVLAWLFKWGYASPKIIKQLSSAKANGYGKKLERKSYLVATPTATGNPPHIFTLSSSGLQEITRKSEDLFRYPEIDPCRVKQCQIRHDLLAQEATLNALSAGTIVGFETERMSGKADQAGYKRPDVTWVLPSGDKIAIEVELTQKWERDLDMFVLAIIQALMKGENGTKPRFMRFGIISDSPAIIKNYKKAMQKGEKFKEWMKNENGKWVVKKEWSIPEWLLAKCDFHLIEKPKKSKK